MALVLLSGQPSALTRQSFSTLPDRHQSGRFVPSTYRPLKRAACTSTRMNRAGHDWLVDWQPTSSSSTATGMVLCRNIAGGIEVGMKFKPTFPTHKPATRTAVVAGGMPTAATGLRSMSRVNRNHRTTPFFGFVQGKGFQLRERPAMNTALGLGLVSALHPLADVGQVFNHNRRARLRRTDDLLTQDMVVVPARRFKCRLADFVPFFWRLRFR